MDQQLYDVAQQVTWYMPDAFKIRTLILVGFHDILCYIAGIRKICGSAGLVDLLVYPDIYVAAERKAVLLSISRTDTFMWSSCRHFPCAVLQVMWRNGTCHDFRWALGLSCTSSWGIKYQFRQKRQQPETTKRKQQWHIGRFDWASAGAIVDAIQGLEEQVFNICNLDYVLWHSSGVTVEHPCNKGKWLGNASVNIGCYANSSKAAKREQRENNTHGRWQMCVSSYRKSGYTTMGYVPQQSCHKDVF